MDIFLLGINYDLVYSLLLGIMSHEVNMSLMGRKRKMVDNSISGYT
jgi:hypothetical protein